MPPLPDSSQVHSPRLRVYTLLFHAAWIAIVVLAAIQRFSVPGEPFVDRDVWGYLSPALVKLNGGAFVQSEGRSFVYPGFVYAMLATFRNFHVITAIQHVLGLATGLLLLANWTTARRLLPQPFLPQAVHGVLGLGLMLIYLLSAQATFGEHHLRPESVSPFFAALSFYCTVRFLVAKRVDRDSRKALLFGFASLSAALVLPYLKPSYWLTTFLTTLPVWWSLFDRREKWSIRLLTVVAQILGAVLLLGVPEHFYAAANPRGRIFLANSLFTIHAPQIREQMARDVKAAPRDLAYPLETVKASLALLDQELPLSRSGRLHTFGSLGFDPDYLLYENSFCRKLVDILPDRDERGAFCKYYFRRTWHEQPGAMFRKVSAQLALFYTWNCPVYASRITYYQSRYKEGASFLASEQYRHVIETFPPAEAYVKSMERLSNVRTPIDQPGWFKVVMNMLANSYLASFLVFGVIVVWVVCNSEDRGRYGAFLAVPALGYAFNLGNNLAIAFFHTLGVGRYSHVQFATTVLVQFFVLWLTVEILSRKFAQAMAGARQVAGKNPHLI